LWHTSYLSQNTYCPEKLASLVLNFNYGFSPLGNGLFRRELLQGKKNIDHKIWCIDWLRNLFFIKVMVLTVRSSLIKPNI
jgi:hypothetical protein